MDLVRFGRIVRALRRRKGWRQADLAARVGVSQALISLVERGHGDAVAVRTLLRIATALDARLVLELRWRAGDLDRLLDEDHASLIGMVVELLIVSNWEVRIEVTYADVRATGSIDVLAWHEQRAALLVVEVKTEVTSAEATIRKLDEKVRIAAALGLSRFGWAARTVSRLLVIEGTTTARQRVARQARLFDAAFPMRSREMRRWLHEPVGAVAGLLFVRPRNGGVGTSGGGGRHRVRVAKPRRAERGPSVTGRAAGARARVRTSKPASETT